jgi:hypothetical protein
LTNQHESKIEVDAWRLTAESNIVIATPPPRSGRAFQAEALSDGEPATPDTPTKSTARRRLGQCIMSDVKDWLARQTLEVMCFLERIAQR